MKSIFILIISLVSFLANAQGLPADPTTGKVVYTGAAQIPAGITPAQAFGRAKVWLSDAFTGHAVLTEDAASGLLSGGGVVPGRAGRECVASWCMKHAPRFSC